MSDILEQQQIISATPVFRVPDAGAAAQYYVDILLSELRREITVGVEQIERGEFTAYSSGAALADEIKAEGRKRFARDNANTHAPA